MQFLRISLLIFAISFIFACSLGTQSYGKLSLSIEVPEYIKTEPNEQANNARFIHPEGEKLEFELYTERRVIHTQTIPLNSQSNSPQTVPISVDKVPYNVSLFAKITVYGADPSYPAAYQLTILGQNKIDIGKLRYPNRKLTLGVKPVSGANVAYEMMDEDGIYLYNSSDIVADTFNIKMYPKKGLYTVYGYFDNIYLYDSDGKNFKNSFFINDGNTNNTLIFYHPEDKANTYYAYLSKETDYLSGEKLDQDILITKPGDIGGYVIVNSGEKIDFGYLNPDNPSTTISFTIYNPYSENLKLTSELKIEVNGSHTGNEWIQEEDEIFIFETFPDVVLPGKNETITVVFQPDTFDPARSYRGTCTISANGLEDFVLIFTGSAST